jgi:hypothetical protein
MAPATQRKKKVIPLDTGNAKIDNYFKPASATMMKRKFDNDENTVHNDENKRSSPSPPSCQSSLKPSSQQPSSQQQGLKPSSQQQSSRPSSQQQQQGLKPLSQQGLKLSLQHQVKRQFGFGENNSTGLRRILGENGGENSYNKRLSPPSSQVQQQRREFGGLGGGLSASNRGENIIPTPPTPSVNLKSRGPSENIGANTATTPKRAGESSRQPLKEKDIKPLSMSKSPLRISTAAAIVPSFKVHCDDEETPIPTSGLHNDSPLLETQYMPETSDTQGTHVSFTSSPVDLSYQEELLKEEGGLTVYRDDYEEEEEEEEEEEDVVEEGRSFHVYKDEEEEEEEESKSSDLFATTEPTAPIKLKNVYVDRRDVETDKNVEARLNSFLTEDDNVSAEDPPELNGFDDKPVITRRQDNIQRKSFFSDNEEEEEEEEEEGEHSGLFSDDDNANFFNDDDDTGSTIDGFFDKQEEKEEQQQNDSPFEVYDDEFSVGIPIESTANAATEETTLTPEFTESIKYYHRPYPIPRGKSFFDKYGMKQEQEEEINDSQEL